MSSSRCITTVGRGTVLKTYIACTYTLARKEVNYLPPRHPVPLAVLSRLVLGHRYAGMPYERGFHHANGSSATAPNKGGRGRQVQA